MNSALEIATVLERFSQSNPNITLSQWWATELQCTEGGSDFHLALAIIQAKVEGLRREIESAELGERSKNLYLAAVDNLSRFTRLSQLGSLNSGDIKKLSTHIDLLFVASEQLPQVLVPEVNMFTIDQIVTQLEELAGAANEMHDVDINLRNTIVSLLSTLVMAIRSYATFGPEGTAKIFGTVAAELHRVAVLPTSQAPNAQTLLSKARKIVTRVGAAVVFAGGVVSGAHAILTDGSEMLGLEREEAPKPADEPSPHPTGHPAASELLAQSDTSRSGEG
jgi:hypothetical protein